MIRNGQVGDKVTLLSGYTGLPKHGKEKWTTDGTTTLFANWDKCRTATIIGKKKMKGTTLYRIELHKPNWGTMMAYPKELAWPDA